MHRQQGLYFFQFLHSLFPKRTSLNLKRAFDIVSSVIGIVVLLPLFTIVAILIKFDSPGPIFYRQKRIGEGGRPFHIFKFRTMSVGADKVGPALTLNADTRITKAGEFLRWSKIDELPQLFNVLAGSMSLVGPRPETPHYMNFYTPEQRSLILSMRPGITDYASILLRDQSSMFDQDSDPVEFYRQHILPIKFVCYQRYVRDRSMLTDLRIILATISTIAVGWSPSWLNIEHDLKIQPSHNPKVAENVAPVSFYNRGNRELGQQGISMRRRSG